MGPCCNMAAIPSWYCLFVPSFPVSTPSPPSFISLRPSVPPFIHQGNTYLIAWAECPLHVMQAICHWIDGINDKPHLSVLCILLPQRLSLCRGGWIESGVGRKGGKRKAGISEQLLIFLLVLWNTDFFSSQHQRPLSFLSVLLIGHFPPPLLMSLCLSVSCSFVFHVPFH